MFVFNFSAAKAVMREVLISFLSCQALQKKSFSDSTVVKKRLVGIGKTELFLSLFTPKSNQQQYVTVFFRPHVLSILLRLLE